jgi:hypothetical protein
MNSVLARSQVGESQPTVAALSSVYAAFRAKVEKSISIMVVSDGADDNDKTEIDLHRRLHTVLASSQGRLVSRTAGEARPQVGRAHGLLADCPPETIPRAGEQRPEGVL